MADRQLNDFSIVSQIKHKSPGSVHNPPELIQAARKLKLPLKNVSIADRTFTAQYYEYDRLCGLVVRVLGYRSRGPGSIPDTTNKKKSSGSGTGSTQPLEYN
jgi:hypothetical protein